MKSRRSTKNDQSSPTSMAKAESSNKSQDLAASNAASDVVPPPTVHVDISDHVAIRSALDDGVAYYLSQDLGLSEDTAISNVKLLAGYVSVAIALFAQFYPLPLKTHRWLLGICVVVYWLIQAGLGWLQSYKLANVIFITKKSPTMPSLIVEAHMKPYDTKYTLKVKTEKSTPGKPYVAEETLEITDYFDTDGLFLRDALNAKLKNIFRFVR